SPFIDYIIVFFMLAAGTNFSLHYLALRGDLKSYFKNSEFKFYIGGVFIFTILMFIFIFNVNYQSIETSLRKSLFQVVSIVTTTGFTTADFEQWEPMAQITLLILMFIGGCAGSTGGSIKNMRILFIVKHSFNEIKKLLHPFAIIPLKVGDRVVSDDIIKNILGFFLIYVGTFALGSIVMSGLGLDIITSISSVAATLGNVGPGLGAVGPMDHYAHIPALGKWILSFFMLLGRLELFTVLVIFTRSYWME
ncbi:MAG: TrkH family potassium uptake protein, partial [Fidelibacterota bacterium]